MTQIFKEDQVLAVTKVKADSCVIIQLKNQEKDGYFGVQLGAGERKEKNIKKPQLDHFKKAKVSKNPSVLKEFRLNKENSDIKVGDMIDISTFQEGDIVDVTGTSKGKGFQGVVKRHGFKGTKATHGNKDQLRMPGSIGATGPAHVFKGTRMGGRMGGNQVTEKNLEIIGVDSENNILLIKGQVPGSRNSIVFIKGKGELKVIKNEELKIKKESVSAKVSADEAKEESKDENKKENIKEETPREQQNKEKKEKVKEDNS